MAQIIYEYTPPAPNNLWTYRVEGNSENFTLAEIREKGLQKPTHFNFTRSNSGVIYHLGSFDFSTLEGCCGVVVSSNSHLEKNYRQSSASDNFRKIKELLANHLGYSLMMATIQTDNIPAMGNLFKSRYKVHETFKNRRTDNVIAIATKKV